MKKTKNIGIILTYNCADIVEKTYKRIPRETLDKIIIVDDESNDNIKIIAKKLGVEFFTHKHLGYGGNMKYGLKKSLALGADYMIEIHGDGQYDPKTIPLALKKITQGYDLLVGSRFVNPKHPLKDKMPITRYIANIILSSIDRIILKVNLTEFHNGFHIYSKNFISKVGFKSTSNGHLYSLEVIAQACFKNLKVCEVPIRCDYKQKHTSITMKKSIFYTVQSFLLLMQFLAAKKGFKYGIFRHY